MFWKDWKVLTCCGISSKQTCTSISSKSPSTLFLRTNTGYVYVRRGKNTVKSHPSLHRLPLISFHTWGRPVSGFGGSKYLLSTAAVSLWLRPPPDRGPAGRPPPQPERPLPSAASKQPCPGELGDSCPARFCIHGAKMQIYTQTTTFSAKWFQHHSFKIYMSVTKYAVRQSCAHTVCVWINIIFSSWNSNMYRVHKVHLY